MPRLAGLKICLSLARRRNLLAMAMMAARGMKGKAALLRRMERERAVMSGLRGSNFIL